MQPHQVERKDLLPEQLRPGLEFGIRKFLFLKPHRPPETRMRGLLAATTFELHNVSTEYIRNEPS